MIILVALVEWVPVDNMREDMYNILYHMEQERFQVKKPIISNVEIWLMEKVIKTVNSKHHTYISYI